MKSFSIAALAALIAFVPPPEIEPVAAAVAGTLFESTPFILAGALLARAFARFGPFAAELCGCGCTAGPARSLPVAVAAALNLGVLPAALRFLAAWAPWPLRRAHACVRGGGAAAELLALLPAAALAALLQATAASRASASLPAVALQAIAALAIPCGFGSLALATALHAAHSPAAWIAFWCGGAAARPLARMVHRSSHDGLAYGLASLACVLIGVRHGAMLVNPHFIPALWLSAPALAALAVRHRNARDGMLRIAPCAMLFGLLWTAPAPQYYAGVTTLADAFAGERIDFTGVVARDRMRTSLVRYAVTCCRADAQPVSIELSRDPRARTGTWLHARGTLRDARGRLVLEAGSLEGASAPHDPFLYR